MNLKLFVVSLLLVALPAFAQAPDPNYGTASEIAYTIPPEGLQPLLPTQTWTENNYSRWITNNNGCCFGASVILPSGVSITALDIEGCDTSAAGGGSLFANMIACQSPVSSCLIVGNFVNTGGAATPGCDRFRANFSPALTVNNSTTNYHIEISTGSDLSGNVSVRSVRVIYKLQVSPAPVTATFSDVPTSHPFFQFIEALAASGITAGCTAPPNPNYCPDAPLTRGQMAVFLSRALGLHFAP